LKKDLCNIYHQTKIFQGMGKRPRVGKKRKSKERRLRPPEFTALVFTYRIKMGKGQF